MNGVFFVGDITESIPGEGTSPCKVAVFGVGVLLYFFHGIS